MNRFTAPSIPEIFKQLDELKPLPFEQLKRELPGPIVAGREQMGMIFGGLVAEGFLIVACERRNSVEELGRTLLRQARSLGVGERVMRHSASLTELGRRGDWAAMREELIATQAEVEQAMVELRDQKMAHLISLGGWIRGLEISAGAVEDNYTPARARVLVQPDLAEYFAEEIKTLPPALAKNPLFEKLRQGVNDIRATLDKTGPEGPSLEDVKSIHSRTRELNLTLRRAG